MRFEDLDFAADKSTRNRYARHTFPNGYGVSVIIGPYTYGGSDGLYELAVLHDGGLCYDTPITNDVCGYLSPDEVTELLAKVEALPSRPTPTATK